MKKKMLLALSMGLIFACSNNQNAESKFSNTNYKDLGWIDNRTRFIEYKASDNNTYLIVRETYAIAIIRLEK